jgi:putative pyruvate formate lyase activating enzyme
MLSWEDPDMEPSYLELHRRGELTERLERLLEVMESCQLCPRACGVNRLEDEKAGYCRTGRNAVVASYSPHFGEERPLVGKYGSGTIFISSCNLLCSFCQNYEISHLMEGQEVDPELMARMMIQLALRGCHNINFVTPTHVVPQIVEALILAVEQGLSVPLVYNSGGYDRVETLRLLEGVFDIYMPDFKFWDARWSEAFCNAPDYRETASAAVKEMHRQVGDLEMDEGGVAQRGLLIRHLVMPNELAGTEAIMRFLADEISANTYVNVMDQYRPCGTADKNERINRRLNAREYRAAVDAARRAGLSRLDPRERARIIFGF